MNKHLRSYCCQRFMLSVLLGILAITLNPALVLGVQTADVASATGGYTFLLNGKVAPSGEFSLEGRTDDFRPGDVVAIKDFMLVLDGPGTYSFRIEEVRGKSSALMKMGPDGKEHPVAVEIFWEEDSDGPFVNPLEKLSAEEMKGLRGLKTATWSASLDVSLGKADLTRCCFTFAACGFDKFLLPELPKGLRYLAVTERSNSGISDLSSISKCPHLRFLFLQLMTIRELDLSSMGPQPELRCSNLNVAQIKDPEYIKHWPETRVLRISGWPKKKLAVTGLQGLKKLRHLSIPGQLVDDLRGLADCPELETIQADQTGLAFLPEKPMPSLKALWVRSTGLKPGDIEAFKKNNPSCHVYYSWNNDLQETIRGATRLLVRTGGTCHRQKVDEKTIWDSSDSAKIAAIKGAIEVEEKGAGFHCMCCGNPTFEFYQGTQLLAEIGFHHGKSMRWPVGWPGDAGLTASSAKYLCEWIAEQGFPNALKEFQESNK